MPTFEAQVLRRLTDLSNDVKHIKGTLEDPLKGKLSERVLTNENRIESMSRGQKWLFGLVGAGIIALIGLIGNLLAGK